MAPFLFVHYRPILAAKNMNVLVQIYNDVPTEISDDQRRLQHVMNNLLSNAVKFYPDNSNLCFSLSYETKMKHSVTFAVRDQGPGISAVDKEQLFKPFVQVRPGELQRGRGSGLGLSICKQMIELHRGSIDCISTVARLNEVDVNSGGRGSEFSFTVPVDFNNIKESNNIFIHTFSSDMVGIMPDEIKDKSNQYSECNELRSLHVLSMLRNCIRSDNGAQSDMRPLIKHAIDVTDQLFDVLNVNSKNLNSERVLIIDGKVFIVLECWVQFIYCTWPTWLVNLLSATLFLLDANSNRLMLQLLLKHRGFVHIDHCANGKDAVDKVIQKGNDYYDLIFVENQMLTMVRSDYKAVTSKDECYRITVFSPITMYFVDWS